MKNKQITIVEHIGDDGVWIWYCLHEKLNEKEAIKAYCKEHGLPCGRIKQEMDGFYSQLQDVRAFKVTLY